MLDELDEDVDTTHSRLRATQKKVCGNTLGGAADVFWDGWWRDLCWLCSCCVLVCRVLATHQPCPALDASPCCPLLQVMDVIKKSGTTTQLGVIVFLMIVLIVLAVVAFM